MSQEPSKDTELAARKAAPQRPGKDIREMVQSDHFKKQVALALPRHMNADRFSRVILTALTRSPKLLECSQESLLRCAMDLSQIGLEADGRNAHLIPFKRSKKNAQGQWESWHECQLIVDWKGYVALARRSGDVSVFQPQLVKENDVFSWRNGVVTHEIDFRKDRGKTECVYSYVRFRDGGEEWEVMTLAEVEAVRQRSKSANDGPWVTDYDEMVKKTVVRRHSKRLDLTPEFIQATEIDDREERAAVGREIIPPAKVPDLLPPAPDALTSKAEASAVAAGHITGRSRMTPLGVEWTKKMELMERCAEASLEEKRVVSLLADNAVTGEESRTFEDLTEEECAAALGLFDKLVAMYGEGGK